MLLSCFKFLQGKNIGRKVRKCWCICDGRTVRNDLRIKHFLTCKTWQRVRVEHVCRLGFYLGNNLKQNNFLKNECISGFVFFFFFLKSILVLAFAKNQSLYPQDNLRVVTKLPDNRLILFRKIYYNFIYLYCSIKH